MSEASSIVSLQAFLDEEWPEVSQEIMAGDGMYKANPDNYFRAGQEALRCIGLALLAANRDAADSILDFACGAGRVMRYLKAGFPNASLTACDKSPPAVAFCQKAFGTQGVVSRWDRPPSEAPLEGPYDLIWVGSLFTHINSGQWPGLLKLFERILGPGGVVVFTIYGRATERLLRTSENLLNLTAAQAKEVLRDYDETGFGFHTNPYDGDSLASRAWVCGVLDHAPSLELLLYMEHGWLGQDVIACKKAAPTQD